MRLVLAVFFGLLIGLGVWAFLRKDLEEPVFHRPLSKKS